MFPKALLSGMAVAGLLYILVAISTPLVASHESVAGSEGALLEVVRQGPFGIHPEAHFRAPTPLLYVGILANAGLLFYTIMDDPSLLLYCGGLLAVGLVLYGVHRLAARQGSTIA